MPTLPLTATVTDASGASASATVAVTVFTVTTPSTVTDLVVMSVTPNSVTLSFTEVNDGTGAPASYDLRSAAGPLTWGTAIDAALVTGTTIGAKRTVTVAGLASATAYQFQLVAFRGTLNVNAVFGQLSNLAAGTTTGLVVPPPPVGGAWPNEPAGLTLVTEQPFSLAIPASQADVALADGWHVIFNGLGLTRTASQADAPFSPPSVLQSTYPTGYHDGAAPGTLWHALPNLTTVYAGFWVKVQAPWQGHQSSGVNKLGYVFAGSAGSCFICFYGSPPGPYQLRLFPQFAGVSQDRWFTQNVATPPFTIGVWHRVEWMLTKAGSLRWALDGVLTGDYSGVPMPAPPFTEYGVTPVWGGSSGETKREDDAMWFDHLRIAGS